ncbi:MAG TPA: hypothetical protein PK140_14630, partial [Polyangiaceae bacterium]|nr:hypothetical protein [Polyangiaceae bacterium]
MSRSPKNLIPSDCVDTELSSWLGLLNATTLGGRSTVVRAEVRSTGVVGFSPEVLRLVVQVYPRRALREGRLRSWARPMASAQRAVSVESLQQGVSVLLAGFERGYCDAHDPVVVVAWVEVGDPDLELGGAES